MGTTANGTYVNILRSESDRVNYIVDTLVNPSILEFRQICIYHEPGVRINSNTWKFAYQNWNDSFDTQIFVNNNPQSINKDLCNIDYTFGKIVIPSLGDNDNILCSYCFDYFSTYVMDGFVAKAINYINVAATGPLSYYNVSDAPVNWDSIIADLVIVYCMEKLIVEYDLWKGKLIFAISPQGLIDGNDNVISQLESIKSSAWDRATKALDNEKLKKSEYCAPPTNTYYSAILFGGGSTKSKGHLLPAMGKLRGLVTNKYGMPH